MKKNPLDRYAFARDDDRKTISNFYE